MGKNNNIIEINGKQYDARSGAALSAPKATPRAAHPSHPTSKPQMHDVIRHPRHVKAHRAQSSKTLMRHTVNRPEPAPKNQLKAHGHTDKLVAKPIADINKKASVHAIDTKRAKHAARVEKSGLIQRFNHTIAAQPPLLMSDAAASLTLPVSPVKAAAPAQDTATLLQHALDSATSHTEKHHGRTRRASKVSRKITGLSAMALSLAVLVGVAGSSIATSFKLHMASAKAGFSVAMPGYKPGGYSVGKVNYSTGVAAIHFSSNSDDRAFTLTEKQSDMNSTALRDNFLNSQGVVPQTIETAGRTIYLYGQHNATWVSGGIWYQVQDTGALSDHQLVEIAKSL